MTKTNTGPDHVDDHAPMRPAPKPKEVQDDLRSVFTAMRSLQGSYPEAFDVAYSRSVRGEGSGSTAISESDPTGNVTLAKRQRHLRATLNEASRKIAEAANRLSEAQMFIKRAMDHDGIDVYADGVRVMRDLREGRIPPKMNDKEMAPLQEAQRRRERGEA